MAGFIQKLIVASMKLVLRNFLKYRIQTDNFGLVKNFSIQQYIQLYVRKYMYRLTQ